MSESEEGGSGRGVQTRRLLREAEQELETAVEQGDVGQARYWLGRKRGIEDAVEAFNADAGR